MKMVANQTRKLRIVASLGREKKKQLAVAAQQSPNKQKGQFELKPMPLEAPFLQSASNATVQSKSFRLFTTHPEGGSVEEAVLYNNNNNMS